MVLIAGFLCGFIFGWGLLISGMMQPTKVLGFLDIFGAWDASLIVVMVVALVVSGLGFALVRRRARPMFAPESLWPTRNDVDGPLIAGAALFGIGWGLVGLCPGPALENLASLSPQIIVFVAAMAAGMVLHDLWQKRRALPAAREVAAGADG